MASPDVTAFRLTSIKAPTPITATKEGVEWRLGSGKDALIGDPDHVGTLLSSATFLSAKNFLAEKKDSPQAKKLLAGAKRVARLELTTKNSKAPVELELFERKFKDGKKEASQAFATVSTADALFEVETLALDKLNQGLKDLRLAKLMTTMERFGARKIEISRTKPSSFRYELTLKDNQWSDPTLGLVNDKVQAMLDSLSGNRIQDALSSAPAGMAEGLSITLRGEKDAITKQWVFWTAGEKLYGQDLASSRRETLVLDPTLKATLPWTREAFKPAKP